MDTFELAALVLLEVHLLSISHDACIVAADMLSVALFDILGNFDEAITLLRNVGKAKRRLLGKVCLQ